jgi:Protein of unknown function (DUF1761)
MFYAKINLFAVGVSALLSLALGFIWFTVIFREPYLIGLGKTPEQLAQGPSMLEAVILQLIGDFIMACVLAWLIVHTGQQTVIGGIRLGVLTWLGFIAAVIGPMYAFQAFSLQFFAITAGYPLVILLIMGAILGGWRSN